MFNLNEIMLFNKPVNNGKIGLMEKGIFFSLGKYYSKKDGTLITEEELLQIDNARLQQIKKQLKFTFSKTKKEALIKEQKAISELLQLRDAFNIENYPTLRSYLYYILNAAKSCEDKFVYSRKIHNKNDFQIAFTRSKDLKIIEPIVFPSSITSEQYKNSFLNQDYAESFDIIDFEKVDYGISQPRNRTLSKTNSTKEKTKYNSKPQKETEINAFEDKQITKEEPENE